MKTTDFTMKKCVSYDLSALTNLPLVAVSSFQLSRLLLILSLHWNRQSGTVNTIRSTGSMPPPKGGEYQEFIEAFKNSSQQFALIFGKIALEDRTIPRYLPISRLWIQAVIETAMLYEKCTAMALRPALAGCKKRRLLSVSSPDFMMKTTDFTMKECVFYDPSALTNLPLLAVSSLQLNRQLNIPSQHGSRLSDTVNTNRYTCTMPSPGANRTDAVPIRLVFRIFRLWIHAVIETAMLYEKCTAMALRPALTGCKKRRLFSVSSPGDFMMKTTDFTMKECVFYDPSALTNLPLVAVSSLQLSRLLKILNLHYALCTGVKVAQRF
ncbi:hypothetical protein T02_6229 [Trichinella nativa]|uniref:Uncharacterized protein n=1 Tax=Trichinella nativa TaxID=6335 RepID=A0A0V1L431_9BILA|nr:hypothetical protein T02_6229 [Trichinella nativa]